MNLPNKLTVLRMILVPVFLIFLLVESIPYHALWALLTFAAASITDCLDGKIARKYHLITTFGKFLDPLADKILVLAAMIALIPLGLCPAVVIIIVIAREFAVTSLRLVAASEGVVIAAGKSGKVKTAVQMVSIVAILLGLAVAEFVTLPFSLVLVSQVLMWITAALAVYSGAEYLIKNAKFFTQSM